MLTVPAKPKTVLGHSLKMMVSLTPVPHTAEHLRSCAAGEAATSLTRYGPGRDLREFYPEVVSVDEASPLGLVLRRLSQALDAADSRTERRFTAELVGVVPDLHRFALSLTRDATESEDLVQFTLLRAWEYRAKFEPGTRLKAWLFTILRNGYLNARIKHRREVPDPEGMHAAGLSSLADQEHRLDVRDMQRALGRLDPAQREALLLVAVEDLSYEAAAARIGCPPGTAKSRVSRARDRLAAALGEA